MDQKAEYHNISFPGNLLLQYKLLDLKYQVKILTDFKTLKSFTNFWFSESDATGSPRYSDLL